MILAVLLPAGARAVSPNEPGPGEIDRGRYLARIAGCNGCHTPGFREAGDAVPETERLLGDRLGWQGPWGTTYAGNLRLFVKGLQAEDWLRLARTAALRPPMSWFSLRAMTDADLLALYLYLRQLGPEGVPAPAYLPPGGPPEGPVVIFPGAPKL